MDKYKRIDKRIQNMFEKCEFDDDLLGTNISKDSVAKIHDYQIFHVINLISCLKKNNAVIDGSHTGTGKTYTAICVCKEMKLRPLIICPKSIISIWKMVCDYFDVHPLAIINYETIKKGRTTKDKNKIKVDITDIIDNNDDMNNDNEYETDKYISINESGEYEWKFDDIKDAIVIFDEAHKCKNSNTLNGKLLLSLKKYKIKILLLSATIADKPDNFKVFGYILGFYPTINKGRGWINGILRDDNNRLDNVSSLYDKLYPYKGSRMSLDDIGTETSKNQISVDCYTLDKKSRKDIDIYYKEIRDACKTDNYDGSELVMITRARQKIELLKIPIVIDLIDKYLENGKYVVVFVNFLDTISKLEAYMKENNIEYGTITGNQTQSEREIEISKFQTNMTKVMICSIRVTEGISLHDLTGKAPRVTLILPSFSSTDLIQALGRCCRSGMKSNVIQKIIFCSDTYEKLIADKLKEKLKFYTQLGENDKNKQVTMDLISDLK